MSTHHKCREIMAELGKEGTFVYWDDFKFPPKIPLTKRIKDILEENVDEKYYLSQKLLDGFMAKKERRESEGKSGFEFKPLDGLDVCPTISARYHKTGSADPYIKEQVGVVGMLDVKGNDSIRRVYGVDGECPAITTMGGGNREPKILEPTIAASRGRNMANPSDRTAGAPTQQRLEINRDGVSNTLTTVQKDNYLIEPSIYQRGRGFNDGCIVDDNISPRISVNAWEQNNYLLEPTIIDLTNDFGEDNKREYGEYAPALRAARHGLATIQDYRIRKLTPRECARLQGDFEDRFNMGGFSNSKLYEFIGNAIDISTYRHLLRSIVSHHMEQIENWNEVQEPTFERTVQDSQKSLFDF